MVEARPLQIVARPLTAEAFAPFGEVVALGAGQPGSDAYAADLANRRPDARLNVSISRSSPIALPLKVKAMEMHPHSAQAFLPIEISRYLILVCGKTADGGPDIGGIRAFIAQADQGINYKPATWHHPFTVLDAPSRQVMLRYDKDDAEDTLWHDVADGPTIVAG